MLTNARTIDVPEVSTPVDETGAGIAFINGEFMPASQATISVFDFGFSHCDAAYDVAHVWNGAFFRLDDHVGRFLKSVRGCHLTIPFDRAGLVGVLHECVRRSRLREAYVDMIATRGRPPAGSRDLRACTDHTLIVYAIPYVWVLPREKIQSGAQAIISDVPRIPKACVNPRYKNFHWGDFNQSLFQAYDKGADTVVLLDLDGNVTEGPGFNVFIIRDAHVVTPSDNVLEGVTRKTIPELCLELGLDVRAECLKANDLRGADEVFISSTAGGIYPIVKVDECVIGDGAPGRDTVRIGNLYWKKKLEGWHGTPIDYSD